TEDRWFAPARDAFSSYVRICNQEVPFGTNLLFSNYENCKLCFAVEFGSDLFAPVNPGSYHAVYGASIIFNLSASYEEAGFHEYRRELVRIQSARYNSAYVCASAGTGESTTDGVFGGYGIIAENGVVLEESERFFTGCRVVMADVDFESLASEKMKNGIVSKGMGQAAADSIPAPWMNASKYRKVCFYLKGQGRKFEGLKRYVNPYPFVPQSKKKRDEYCSEIIKIQATGLARRMLNTRSRRALIGVSGGLDSTLALLVTVNSFDMMKKPREDIIGITMPGFGTTKKTYDNAMELMRSLGVTTREIDIKPACLQHFKDIGHDPGVHDVTYENVQARERSQVLMDIANKENGLVIGAGDLSELALGWCTYNGDHMSMYNVNCGVPKTMERYLLQWAAGNMADEKTRNVLLGIIDTPITPELLPPTSRGDISQKTEDIVGPYELHDFFLYHMLRYGTPPKKMLFLAEHAFAGKYSADTIKGWLKVFYRRFFSQQFKRSCMPDGPRVSAVSLSPRGAWSMPSDGEARAWLEELENE
ncbi:MAG: NAD(+) synthase, partial [Clostridiaceae bacterium]|nr:NAD(+) synthase [Clostridiaceae bacterium]